METSGTEQKKVETSKPQPNRAQRRATMRRVNNKLFADRKLLIAELERLQNGNRSMNFFLNDLARTIGIQIPKTAAEGVNAADQMRDRIIQLVELEKKTMADIRINGDFKDGELSVLKEAIHSEPGVVVTEEERVP